MGPFLYLAIHLFFNFFYVLKQMQNIEIQVWLGQIVSVYILNIYAFLINLAFILFSWTKIVSQPFKKSRIWLSTFLKKNLIVVFLMKLIIKTLNF